MGFVLLMASCSDSYTDWADPQSNAQEDAKTVTLSVSPAAAIVLGDVTADSVQLFVPNITSVDQATNSYTTVLYNADKTSTSTITASEDGKVAVSDLKTAVYSLYGRRPVARTIDMDISSYSLVSGVSIKNSGSTTATITPDAPVIDSEYFITGSNNGWNNNDKTYAVQNGGGDPYDDPVFTIKLSAATVGTGIEFKLTPASGIGGDWSGCVTASVDGTEGKLASNNAGGNLKVNAVDGAVAYMLSFNLLDQTWTVTPISYEMYLYEAGDGNGWTQTDILAGPKYNGSYAGYMYLSTAFKFCTQPNWTGTNYGENFSTDGSAANMTNENPGFYRVEVDLENKTINKILISTIGLIGDATAGGWDNSTPMVYNSKDRSWEVTATLTTGTFKFRANDGWTYNWGGSIDNLTQDGDNINVTAGTYKIKLFPYCDGKSYCTMTTVSSAKKRK